jgi:hypothetical protein
MASLVSELGPAEGELYFLLCKFNTGTTFVETDPTAAAAMTSSIVLSPASTILRCAWSRSTWRRAAHATCRKRSPPGSQRLVTSGDSPAALAAPIYTLCRRVCVPESSRKVSLNPASHPRHPRPLGLAARNQIRWVPLNGARL